MCKQQQEQISKVQTSTNLQLAKMNEHLKKSLSSLCYQQQKSILVQIHKELKAVYLIVPSAGTYMINILLKHLLLDGCSMGHFLFLLLQEVIGSTHTTHRPLHIIHLINTIPLISPSHLKETITKYSIQQCIHLNIHVSLLIQDLKYIITVSNHNMRIQILAFILGFEPVATEIMKRMPSAMCSYLVEMEEYQVERVIDSVDNNDKKRLCKWYCHELKEGYGNQLKLLLVIRQLVKKVIREESFIRDIYLMVMGQIQIMKVEQKVMALQIILELKIKDKQLICGSVQKVSSCGGDNKGNSSKKGGMKVESSDLDFMQNENRKRVIRRLRNECYGSILVILEDEAREVRLLALEVVEQFSQEEKGVNVLTLLYDMCNDENDQVRMKAVQLLTTLQKTQVFGGHETSIVIQNIISFYSLIKVLKIQLFPDLIGIYKGLQSNMNKFEGDINEILLVLKDLGRNNHSLLEGKVDTVIGRTANEREQEPQIFDNNNRAQLILLWNASMFNPQIRQQLPKYMEMHFRCINHEPTQRQWFYQPNQMKQIELQQDSITDTQINSYLITINNQISNQSWIQMINNIKQILKVFNVFKATQDKSLILYDFFYQTMFITRMYTKMRINYKSIDIKSNNQFFKLGKINKLIRNIHKILNRFQFDKEVRKLFKILLINSNIFKMIQLLQEEIKNDQNNEQEINYIKNYLQLKMSKYTNDQQLQQINSFNEIKKEKERMDNIGQLQILELDLCCLFSDNFYQQKQINKKSINITSPMHNPQHANRIHIQSHYSAQIEFHLQLINISDINLWLLIRYSDYSYEIIQMKKQEMKKINKIDDEYKIQVWLQQVRAKREEGIEVMLVKKVELEDSGESGDEYEKIKNKKIKMNSYVRVSPRYSYRLVQALVCN